MKIKRINDLKIVDIPTESEIERRNLTNFIAKILLATLLTIIIIASIVIGGSISLLAGKLPDVRLLKNYTSDQTTLIYDVNNKLVANIHGDEDRVTVPLSKISPYLQQAVIAIEDNRFYEHKGIDFLGTLRATVNNFGGDSVQGGSTLTQQLVKNSFLSPERSVKRKLIEAMLAIRVEQNFDKKKILEMYLNQIYWGNLCFGAEKAAKKYFKKNSSQLDIAESALLAGLLKAPEGYSPYIHYKLAKERQMQVLERMEHYGFITHDQKTSAEKEKLHIYKRTQIYSKYPYFIDYISILLRRTYGDDAVKRGGLRVYTTLDPRVQDLAEKVITKGVKSMSSGTGVRQGALVSINVDNGYIQALVGGVDYKKSNYNRAVLSRRAAGSSFKPVVYLTGLRLGYINDKSPILDAPISFNTGWSVWSPKNWDGKFMGKLTVRKALTLSRNTPTVRIALKVGLDRIIETARLLGIKSDISRDYSIVLGSLGVSPVEMATYFSTLAREGVYIEPIAIRRVEDSQGNILEQHSPNPIQVVKSNYVRELDSILIDVVNKGTGKLARLSDREVAGKTGTTDDVKDVWFTGFTPDTVTTIWLGNDQNTRLNNVFSSNCAQLWGLFSKNYYKIKNISPRYFRQPDNSIIQNYYKKTDKDTNNKKQQKNSKNTAISDNKKHNKTDTKKSNIKPENKPDKNTQQKKETTTKIEPKNTENIKQQPAQVPEENNKAQSPENNTATTSGSNE